MSQRKIPSFSGSRKRLHYENDLNHPSTLPNGRGFIIAPQGLSLHQASDVLLHCIDTGPVSPISIATRGAAWLKREYDMELSDDGAEDITIPTALLGIMRDHAYTGTFELPLGLDPAVMDLLFVTQRLPGRFRRLVHCRVFGCQVQGLFRPGISYDVLFHQERPFFLSSLYPTTLRPRVSCIGPPYIVCDESTSVAVTVKPASDSRFSLKTTTASMSAPAKLFFSTIEVTKQAFYRSPLSYAIVNLKPIVPGHVLVMPTRPVPRISDLTSDELRSLMESVKAVGTVIEKAYNGDSLTVACQDGPAAGQTIPHVHFHILPRKLRGDIFQSNRDAVYSTIENAESELHADLEQAANGLERRTSAGEPLKVDADAERKPRDLEEMIKEADWLRSFFEAEKVAQRID